MNTLSKFSDDVDRFLDSNTLIILFEIEFMGPGLEAELLDMIDFGAGTTLIVDGCCLRN